MKYCYDLLSKIVFEKSNKIDVRYALIDQIESLEMRSNWFDVKKIIDL